MFGPTPQKKAMTPLHVMVGLPIALASVTAPARVEIETPEPPIVAVIDSQRVLIYELHITSFARTPLELRRIEVLGRAALPLATYRDSALVALLQTVGPNGDTHRDDATRNENYWGFDQPVFAVADGEVTEVVDSIPDHAPHVLPGTVTLVNIAGNHVILRIAPHRYVLYAHLERGSVRVHPGERVRRGQMIAKLGDSGQTTAPHLHLHVADGNSVLSAEGVPWVLSSYEDLGSGNTFEVNAHPDTPRERTLPGANEVVRWGGGRP